MGNANHYYMHCLPYAYVFYKLQSVSHTQEEFNEI